jgi:hypothetical protein
VQNLNIDDIFKPQTGFFDIMMNRIDKHIRTQYDKTRIRGQEYATAYVQLLQEAFKEAIKYQAQLEALRLADEAHNLEQQIKTKDLELKTKELELAGKNIEATQAKIDLYKRQTEGFRDKAQHDMVKTVLDGWSILKTQNQDITNPDVLGKQNIDNMFKDAIKTVGLNIDTRLNDTTVTIASGAIVDPEYPEGTSDTNVETQQ